MMRKFMSDLKKNEQLEIYMHKMEWRVSWVNLSYVQVYSANQGASWYRHTHTVAR